MRPLTILVDMDDTIECMLKTWVKWLNRKYDRNVDPKDVTNWDMRVAFPGLTYDDMGTVIGEKEFWEEVEPMKDAQEILPKLIEDGHKLYVVTASTYNQVEPKIKYCLEKHFPYLSWYDVFVTFHKQMIKADVLVDDGYHNLVGGEYLKILLDKPYNQSNDDEKNDIHRVYNWYEAYDLIKKEAEKEAE